MSDNPITSQQEALARKNFNEFFRQWWFSVVVMITICGTSLLSQQHIEQLALSHEAIDQGALWHILTSQLVHLNVNHTLLNLVGYLIVSASFREDITPPEEAITLLTSIIGVGVGIYFFSPEILWYVGLSGAIYGILTHYLIVGWKRSPMLSLFFGVFLLGKFYYEQFVAGPDTVTAQMIGGMVAIDSHLYGAITGLISGIISYFTVHRRAPKPTSHT